MSAGETIVQCEECGYRSSVYKAGTWGGHKRVDDALIACSGTWRAVDEPVAAAAELPSLGAVAEAAFTAMHNAKLGTSVDAMWQGAADAVVTEYSARTGCPPVHIELLPPASEPTDLPPDFALAMNSMRARVDAAEAEVARYRGHHEAQARQIVALEIRKVSAFQAECEMVAVRSDRNSMEAENLRLRRELAEARKR